MLIRLKFTHISNIFNHLRQAIAYETKLIRFENVGKTHGNRNRKAQEAQI